MFKFLGYKSGARDLASPDKSSRNDTIILATPDSAYGSEAEREDADEASHSVPLTHKDAKRSRPISPESPASKKLKAAQSEITAEQEEDTAEPDNASTVTNTTTDDLGHAFMNIINNDEVSVAESYSIYPCADS